MKKEYIKATEEFCSFEKHVAAPLLRKSFQLDFPATCARISVCALGFYILTVNGVNVTKGHIAPYISNPNDFCYYDEYDVTEYLSTGENVIGIMLGNGFMNAFGGAVWDFQKANFRGAPELALEFSCDFIGGRVEFSADESFRTHPSPLLFDDLRLGEIYDASLELDGWNLPGFDDSDWGYAIPAKAPEGEMRLCTAEPIRVLREIKPVSVTKQGDAYLYDFGVNTAGVCRLNLVAQKGQKITMWHGEYLRDGIFNNDRIRFDLKDWPYYRDYNQTVRYYASGKGTETFTPYFSYYGFRYVLVEGISEKQATDELLTYLVMSSDIKTVGGFTCSDERANKLYQMVRNSDRSNFFYFPTDCPHREKNGWTGDASMSADHMILMHDVSASFSVWLDNIRKAQNDQGALPGIIPTAGWGFAWGNGPLWDSVIFNLPYEMYKRRGNFDVIRDNADAMIRYLKYILTRRSPDGTVAIGLGDWCQVGRHSGGHDSPLVLTDSITVMNIAEKAAEMLSLVGMQAESDFAKGIYLDMRDTIRRELVDFDTMTVKGNCQTSQAAALYYGVFDECEEHAAFSRLLEIIKKDGNRMASGLLGLHVIFHVLSKFGHSELAYDMIMAEGFPSYAYLLESGETSIPEKFMQDPYECGSHNHHFFGDVARWFTRYVAGLEIVDFKTVKINKLSVPSIDFASAWYDLPSGRVTVSQHRLENGEIKIEITAPEGVTVLR